MNIETAENNHYTVRTCGDPHITSNIFKLSNTNKENYLSHDNG